MGNAKSIIMGMNMAVTPMTMTNDITEKKTTATADTKPTLTNVSRIRSKPISSVNPFMASRRTVSKSSPYEPSLSKKSNCGVEMNAIES